MKKILIFSFALMLAACSSDSKILGKWKTTVETNGAAATEICSYVENHTEICEETINLNMYGNYMQIKYFLTQEWQLDGSKLLEKTMDATITEISIDGQALGASDPRYQNSAAIILGKHPKGETLSRKISFDGDSYQLFQKNGEITKYTRVK